MIFCHRTMSRSTTRIIPALFTPPQPKRVIGLIGGIASGKSTARTLLSQEIIPKYILANKHDTFTRTEIPILDAENDEISQDTSGPKSPSADPTMHLTIIDADLIGHSIYLKGTPAYEEILTRFTPYLPENVESLLNPETQEIDRRVLGSIVFGDEERMIDLQQIVWPRIKERIQKEVQESNTTHHGGFIILEAAILLEARWHEELIDEIWCMSANRDVVVRRLKKRNGLTEEEADKRLASQWTNEQREAYADVIVRTNSDDGGPLRERLEKVFLQRYRHLCLPKWGVLPLWYPVVKHALDSGDSDSTIDNEQHQQNIQLIQRAVNEIGQQLDVFLLFPPQHEGKLDAKHLAQEYERHISDALKSFYDPVFGVEMRTPPHGSFDKDALRGIVHVAERGSPLEEQMKQLQGEYTKRRDDSEEHDSTARRVLLLPQNQFSSEQGTQLKALFDKSFQVVDLHE